MVVVDGCGGWLWWVVVVGGCDGWLWWLVVVGGYGGWFCVRMMRGTSVINFRIKYFHGSGGGGPVTQGAINLTRALGKIEGADVYCMGHIHENSARVNVRETLRSCSGGYEIVHQEIHMMVCGCYKEEWNGGHSGWHVERGAGIKPIGARILDLSVEKSQRWKGLNHQKGRFSQIPIERI